MGKLAAAAQQQQLRRAHTTHTHFTFVLLFWIVPRKEQLLNRIIFFHENASAAKDYVGLF